MSNEWSNTCFTYNSLDIVARYKHSRLMCTSKFLNLPTGWLHLFCTNVMHSWNLIIARWSLDWSDVRGQFNQLSGSTGYRGKPDSVCVCVCEMFEALPPCARQLGDRTGSSACRKWKICHIFSKLRSGRAPFLLWLPSPLCSLVWSRVDFRRSQLPSRARRPTQRK